MAIHKKAMLKSKHQTVLQVTNAGGDKLSVAWPRHHAKSADIERWLKYLSPGYTEHLLHFGTDPHCSSCKDMECDNVGHGDDACRAFKFGLEW